MHQQLIIDAVRYREWLECPRKAWFGQRPGPSKADREGSFSEFGSIVKRAQHKTLRETAAAMLGAGDILDLSLLSMESRLERTAGIAALFSLSEEGRRSPRTVFLGTAFSTGNFFSEPEILVMSEGKTLELYGSTSSVSVKDKHLSDLAWHLFLLRSKKLDAGLIGLFRIEKEAQLPSGIPLVKEEVTRRVLALADKLREKAEALQRDLEAAEPPAFPSRQDFCAACPHQGSCNRVFPGHHVRTLHSGAALAEEMLRKGINSIADIPEGTKLSRKQKIQIEAVKTDRPQLDLPAIEAFLSSLDFPFTFLDFETFGTALPLFSGLAPWEIVPFQFSLHRLPSWEEEPVGLGFLADEKRDPREEFLKTLLATLPKIGSILVYNRRFEEGVLRRLGEQFPETRDELEVLFPRLRDLLSPFAEFRYYHPDQLGKVSMKRVLPSMTGRSYSGLIIANGEEANTTYAGMVYLAQRGELDGRLRDRAREALKKYCALDTEGMVLILRELRRITEKKD